METAAGMRNKPAKQRIPFLGLSLNNSRGEFNSAGNQTGSKQRLKSTAPKNLRLRLVILLQ